MYLNKMFVAGNLTRDPELVVTPAGVTICKFSIATNESYYNKEKNEKVESVEYHNLVAFGKQGETIKNFFSKGKPIFVEGKLKTSSWEDKDTTKKMYRTEIIVNEFKFMNDGNQTKKQPSGDDYPMDANGAIEAIEKENSMSYDDIIPSNSDDINPEDIPF